jgi:uncharacterized FAD-dependent dehydrogenase
MIDTIINFGGEVYFDKICTDLILEKTSDDKFISKGIRCGSEEIFADAVILATGHSATDIYQMLNDVLYSFLFCIDGV